MDLLLEAGDVPFLHDGLVAVVDMDAQEDPDCVVAVLHMVLYTPLREREREMTNTHNYY